MEFPQLDEFVVAKIKKIMPFGAVLELEEHGGMEAFVHISEVSSGWIRNIREHLKEGQVVVGKVVATDPSKRQVDVSLKRITQGEKKRKLEEWQNAKRAEKLLQRALEKAGKTLKQVETEVQELIHEFGSLYDVFDALSKKTVPKAKASKALLQSLQEVAEREIKQKMVEERRILKLSSFAPDGAEQIKKILAEIAASGAKVHYVGAPVYYLDITTAEVKAMEKTVQKLEALLAEKCAGESFEWSLEQLK